MPKNNLFSARIAKVGLGADRENGQTGKSRRDDMIIEREKRTITFNPVGVKYQENKDTMPPLQG
ncbi:MAG: hypothetical protein HBSAPP01_20450 [Candidatus Brocadia sapporoensis]|nr:MAG: hypothetical protein HBSAPP01_20450 [Candidatus Brocadia sapporoensis]